MTTMEELTAARRQAFEDQPFATLRTVPVPTFELDGSLEGMTMAPPSGVVDLFARRLIADIAAVGGSDEMSDVMRDWMRYFDGDAAAAASISLAALGIVVGNRIAGPLKDLQRSAALSLWVLRVALE